MKTLSFWKKSVYSALVFFGTLMILSIGYSLVGNLSTADKVESGSGLSSASWNRIVDGVLDLDTRLSNFSFVGGKVGIGTTSPIAKLDVDWIISTSDMIYIRKGASDTIQAGPSVYLDGGVGSSYTQLQQWVGKFTIWGFNGGTWGEKMTVNDISGNTWIAGTLVQASDIRLKKEISPIENSLDRISRLNGVTYYWKDSVRDSKRQIGAIAQDVEKVFPEAVATDEKGMKSVAYGNLVAPLIEAVKELKKENKTLEARLEKLEKK